MTEGLTDSVLLRQARRRSRLYAARARIFVRDTHAVSGFSFRGDQEIVPHT
jgi:hypothetical protein